MMISNKGRVRGPRTTFREIIDSGKMTGIYELNSQIRSIVRNRTKSMCANSCDVVDTPCERGHECAAFKFLMKLVDTDRKGK